MSPCSVQCVNTFGSYHCTCPAGYQLGADGRSCEYKVVLKVIVKVVMKVVHLQGHVESQMFWNNLKWYLECMFILISKCIINTSICGKGIHFLIKQYCKQWGRLQGKLLTVYTGILNDQQRLLNLYSYLIFCFVVYHHYVYYEVRRYWED